MEAAVELRHPNANPGVAAPAQRQASSPCLWAVAGGKGGVGKSLVASSLAVSFAAQGQRCVLVDGDLGGANLHTLVGVERPRLTLSQFFAGEVAQLSEVTARTAIPRLSLVGGDDALLDMANPKHARKEKLLRHLRGLQTDHVILDLGAGSSFNVLDLFLAAERGILVTQPEPTSIDNTYHFLKAAFLRSLREVARLPEIRAHLERVLAENRRLLSPRELVAGVAELDPTAGEMLEERAAAFAPLLIVNQARRPEDRELGWELRSAARERLGAGISYLGCLEWDELVIDAVRRRQPVRQLFPGSAFCQGVDAIAERLLDPSAPNPERPRPRSRLRLVADDADGSHLPPLDLSDPSGTLRRCREHLGLSREEIHQHTRIPCVDRIERGYFADLPPEPYLRGFVLLYARSLGIPDEDARALTGRYLQRVRVARPA